MKTSIILLLVTAFSLVSAQQPPTLECSHNRHCPLNVGLVCDGGSCKCGNGTLLETPEESYNYVMEWEGRCVGSRGSACIGVGSSPLPSGQIRIPCKTGLTCVQIKSLPKGQGTCKLIPSVLKYNSDCSESRYCDGSLGLICQNSKCVCGNGVVNDKLNFTLAWRLEMERCFAVEGSGCVGTRLNPVGSSMKSVECWDSECVQLGSMPPGIGVCVRDGGVGPSSSTSSESPTTLVTEEDDGSSTTPSDDENPPNTTTGGGYKLASFVYVVLVSLVLSMV